MKKELTPVTSALIERIKSELINLVSSDTLPKSNLSVYLSEKLNYHYTYMANVFSGTQGKSIQQYFIELKIDRVKLLLLTDITLTKIAELMNYSSVAHLSNQFKDVTGQNPTQYLKSLIVPVGGFRAELETVNN